MVVMRDTKHRGRNIKFALIIFVLFVCVRCIDPASVELHRVDRIQIIQDLILLHIDDRYTVGIGGGEGQDFVLMSQDEGKTWRKINNMPPEWSQMGEDPSVNIHSDCLVQDASICYRITGEPYIEQSVDSGLNWQIVWQYPDTRYYFSERSWRPSDSFLPLDYAPLDFAILESDQDYKIYFSMGFQGLLIRSSDGNWIRQAVLIAQPIPFNQVDLSKILDILFAEEEIIAIAGISIFLFYFIRAIIIQLIYCSTKTRLWRIIGFVVVAFIYFELFAMKSSFDINMITWFWQHDLMSLYHLFESIQSNPFSGYYLILFWIITIILILSISARNCFWSFLSGFIYIAYPLIAISVAVLPFILWCMAIITSYSVALITSLSLSLLIIILPRNFLLDLPYIAEGRPIPRLSRKN